MDDIHARQRPVRERPLAAGVLVCALVAVGCTSRTGRTESTRAADSTATHTPDGRALQPVSLPDLSTMSASVQKQIRDAHASLTLKIQNRRTQPSELGGAYGELGRILMAADYPDAAEPCFFNAQTLVPDDVRWPYYLGHVYRDRGELAKALPFFERALALQPNDVAALVWLGDTHLAQGRPEQAEPRFAKALSLQPNSLSARFGLGRVAVANEDYRRAVTYLEEVLTLDPEAAGAHYPLGMAYRGLGETGKADVHLRLRKDKDILPADPLMVELEELLESPQAYESRGIRALDRKDWTEATALFRKGLEIAPGNPALRHRLGTALYLMGDEARAQEQFEEVVRASPDYFLAQYSLGVLLQAKGRHAEAIDHFAAAVRSRPSYTEARLRLAMAYARIGRYEEARDRLIDAMKAYPDQSVFAHGLARLLAAAPDDRVRDSARALTLVQELVGKEQRTPDLGETMAMALGDLGRYEEASALQRNLIAGAEKAGVPGIAKRLAGNLSLYERHQPCRTPWSDEEMP